MDDNLKKSSQDDRSLPLPEEPSSSGDFSKGGPNPAADLIRRKVAAAYANEPDLASEAADIKAVGPDRPMSNHQQFILKLTNSGKALPEIQAAWHEYYAKLPDAQKHQVWQEFYSIHSASGAKPANGSVRTSSAAPRTIGELKDRVKKALPPPKDRRPAKPIHSLVFGLGVGAVVIMFTLFSFFNERFIAPFIQPSRNVTGSPIISSDVATGADPEIIIPKINVEIPVVYGVTTVEEAAVQKALENGVVHYADTALPGETGNTVIVGHSSNNIFNRGRYKFAFVLLNRLDNKDVFYLDKEGKRYTYEVYEKKVVKPTDVSVLGATSEPATATLITCDPPGSNTNRLIVVGRQINPDPSTNTARSSQNQLATSTKVVPGNSPSLWSRLIDFL